MKEVLKDISLWDDDLSRLPGFQEMITDNLNGIINDGMKATLDKVYAKSLDATK